LIGDKRNTDLYAKGGEGFAERKGSKRKGLKAPK